jgi:anti-sigma factor RsiW
VRHARARRLLAALPDGTLPARLEGEVRAHAEQCRICGRRVADFEASETLLRLLPVSLLPERSSAVAEARLVALARWSSVPPSPRWPAALGIPALGALAAAATVAVGLSLGSWAPAAEERREQVLYASLYAGPAATPYTWR